MHAFILIAVGAALLGVPFARWIVAGMFYLFVFGFLIVAVGVFVLLSAGDTPSQKQTACADMASLHDREIVADMVGDPASRLVLQSDIDAASGCRAAPR